MDRFKTGSVKANGIGVSFLEMGEGPLVLCLHGFPDHARSFRHQLPALAGAGFRAVAPYMRGYAPSDVPPAGPYQAAVLAQDAVALIRALGYGSATVFGHDWGAVAAYGAAITAPERVDRLVAAAVPPGPGIFQAFVANPEQQRRSWYMFFFQMPFAEDAVAYNDFAFLERIWREWSPGWKYPVGEMESLKETFRKPGVLAAALGYYRHTLNPGSQVPALQDVQRRLFADPVPVPALYLHGERDGCIGVELTEGIEPLFTKGVRKRVIAGAGHFVHQEKPQEVNRLLLEFLAG